MTLTVAVISALLAGLMAGLLLGHYGGPRGVADRVMRMFGTGPYLQPPDPASARWRRERLAFFRASPARAEVVMLGDSHSENGPWSELFPDHAVLNRGIGWDTSQDVLDRLDEVIARKPRTVFLLIGVVDLRYGIDPQQVAGNIEAIAARLRQAGIRTVVQSVLPLAPQLREPTNNRVRVLNERLRRDPDFLDLHPVLAKDGALNPDLTHDGVHLLPPAYLSWARRIAPLLAPS